MKNIQFISNTALKKHQSVSTEEQEILDNINLKISSGQSLNEIMDFFFDSTKELFPSDRMSLAFLEEEEKMVVAHWCRTCYEPVKLNKGYWQDMSGSSLEQILKKRQPRIIHDLELYLEEHPNSKAAKALVQEGIRSSFACLLMVEDRVVGFLFRSSKQAKAYTVLEVAIHQQILEHLSQAVEKAYMIDQLQKFKNSYLETLGFVAHELKSPISSIILDGKVLTGGYLGNLTDKQKDKIGKMVSKGEYLVGLIREYLNLARIEGGKMETNFRKDVDIIKDVVDLSLSMIESQIKEKNCKIIKDYDDSSILIDCDPEQLGIVFTNLLSNAVKYGDQDGEVRIVLVKMEDSLAATIWNKGPGFPADQEHLLFRKFSRIKTKELLSRKGSGVGLYNVWQIIQLHGGRISAVSKLGEWAEFSLIIPSRQNVSASTEEK